MYLLYFIYVDTFLLCRAEITKRWMIPDGTIFYTLCVFMLVVIVFDGNILHNIGSRDREGHNDFRLFVFIYVEHISVEFGNRHLRS